MNARGRDPRRSARALGRAARPVTSSLDRPVGRGSRARGGGGAACAGGAGREPVAGVAYDSRRSFAGRSFVAIAGEHVDGHDFLDRGTGRRGRPRLVEHPARAAAPRPSSSSTDTRRALAVAAAWWYGDPSARIGVVGITGTDGKTTTAFLAVAALEAAGVRAGLGDHAETKIGGGPPGEPGARHDARGPGAPAGAPRDGRRG